MPPLRQGPRPLPLHLAATLLAWQSSSAGWNALRSGSLAWSESLKARAETLIEASRGADDAVLQAALTTETQRRAVALVQAIATYRHHPYRRNLPPVPTVWRQGSTQLLDYGPPNGQPLLVIPSLVNRAYVLDLSARLSLLRWLGGQGFRPLLVDWDRPGETERRFSLTDYVCGRLVPALAAARQLASGPPLLLGYCMGGLLALALALQRPAEVRALALLATPWDFHADGATGAQRLASAATLWGPLLDSLGELPVDAVQGLFMLLDPLLVARKFLDFARLDPASERAAAFVALEDWLNDGVGLAAPVARECLAGWYGENTPARGLWRIAGETVAPNRLTCPTLVQVPQTDRIVPPGSALALAAVIPGARVERPSLGHIGMVVAGAARDRVWAPLAAWLKST